MPFLQQLTRPNPGTADILYHNDGGKLDEGTEGGQEAGFGGALGEAQEDSFGVE